MRRRRYLAGVVAGLGAIAGCSSDSSAPQATTTQSPTPGPGAATNSTARQFTDVDLPLPESELSRGAAKDAIPAITDPTFAADWSAVGDGQSSDPTLAPEDRVIGVVRDGNARAYPLRVLNLHEIVNDEFGGPLLVTFCPLCGSGVSAIRQVGGEETIFGVSGLLWQSDLVMYDQRTESLWSQIMATAIRGPRTGDELTLVPSSITTWTTWRETHPDTVVMLPPPASETITGRSHGSYRTNPYAGYERSDRIGIGYNEFDDDRLHPKTQVIGVTHDGTANAYPLPAVTDAGVVNDTVGGQPIVVAATADGTLVAYERRQGDETLSFARADEARLAAGGSRWSVVSGTAVDGPHEGTTLQIANDRSQMFWFAWLDFHPETDLYGE